MDFLNTDIKRKIIKFTEQSVADFLEKNKEKTFYAFCFDTNVEYGELNLSINTLEEFEKTLGYYQNNYPDDYNTDESIFDLKYNSGDWTYNCFATVFVVEDKIEEHLSSVADTLGFDEVDNCIERIREFFTECFLEFMETEVYKKIPKTDDFKAFCLDHDEDLEDFYIRIDKLNNDK